MFHTIRKQYSGKFLLLLLLAFSAVPVQAGPVYRYRGHDAPGAAAADPITVIGELLEHEVAKGETLLDIARAYGLGFNEMEDLYPEMDPWIPKPGDVLVVPSRWVLPEDRRPGIVINVAEMRLYHFLDGAGSVRTFPVAVGQPSWPTPIGGFRVHDKRTNPFWYIPPSLQGQYGLRVVPPGPDNPLGDYFMGIGDAVGIHGTDFAWSVGRLVTHGCIRLYPEDIRSLFPTVSRGTPVQTVYEPVKIGRVGDRIFLEAHRDVYGRIPDYRGHALQRIAAAGLSAHVDPTLLDAVLERRSGVPVEVGTVGLTATPPQRTMALR